MYNFFILFHHDCRNWKRDQEDVDQREVQRGHRLVIVLEEESCEFVMSIETNFHYSESLHEETLDPVKQPLLRTRHNTESSSSMRSQLMTRSVFRRGATLGPHLRKDTEVYATASLDKLSPKTPFLLKNSSVLPSYDNRLSSLSLVKQPLLESSTTSHRKSQPGLLLAESAL